MEETITSTADFKKYLKKLKYIISNDATFKFGNKHLLEKKKVDDILCCVEASWPKEYKVYISKKNPRKLRCPESYKNMIKAIKNKFFFSTNHYYVNCDCALHAIDSLIRNIDSDLNYIFKE